MATYELLSLDKEYTLYSEEIITSLDLNLLNLKIWTVLPLDSDFPERTIKNIIKL